MPPKGTTWQPGMNADDAHDWATKTMLKRTLTYASREMAALAEYKNGDFHSINASQRHPARMRLATPERYKWACKHADSLATLLDKHRIPCDLVLYRGFHSALFHQLAAQGPIASFNDDGFTSTSLSKKVAHNLFTQSTKPYVVKCDIFVKAGLQAAYVEPAKFDHRGDSGEAEILLQRGIIFLVKAQTFTNGVLTLELEARKR